MNRRGLFLIGLIAFLSGVCGIKAQTHSTKADEPFEVVKTEKFEGIIIPREKGSDFASGLFQPEVKEFWTPDKVEVLKLERGISAYLKKPESKASPGLWSKLMSYKRQYVGIVKNGHKKIFANFFCDAGGRDWKTTPIFVLDGGDCFFTILYDPNSDAFSDLSINGEA